MTAEAQTRAIGAHAYEVMPLPAKAALRVMTRVLKMGAPAFAEVSSLREAASAVGTLLSAGLANLDEDVILFASEELAKVTRVVDGDKALPLAPIFDEHFRGRVGDLFAWLRFAAEVTYGPLGDALGKMLTASPAPPSAPAAG